jgi:hypothetical protein
MITYEVKVSDNGTRKWHLNGKRHREDGPAVEYADGDKAWYLNDQLHREDGPAIEHSNGDKEWCLNEKYHREDGPAVEYADGDKEWWINGNELTKDEFNSRNQNYITIEGKTAQLSPETVSQLKKLLDSQ